MTGIRATFFKRREIRTKVEYSKITLKKFFSGKKNLNFLSQSFHLVKIVY